MTCVAVRPCVVDTEMQAQIRREGPKTMPPERAAYFLDLKSEGHLEPPHVPARSIAWLALHAPKDFNGEFVSYDDPVISRSSQLVFDTLFNIYLPASEKEAVKEKERHEKNIEGY